MDSDWKDWWNLCVDQVMESDGSPQDVPEVERKGHVVRPHRERPHHLLIALLFFIWFQLSEALSLPLHCFYISKHRIRLESLDGKPQLLTPTHETS